MEFNYPKEEKLKSKKTIELLFSNGQSVAKYPLRLVYIESDYGINAETKNKLKFGISVSKKNFKKAVDRNYFKRVLRETYRLNKHILTENIKKPFAIMFFYQTKERLKFDEINKKTIQLFEKFLIQIQQNSAE